jgi:hypothetical protein
MSFGQLSKNTDDFLVFMQANFAQLLQDTEYFLYRLARHSLTPTIPVLEVFHSGVVEDSVFVGCDAALLGDRSRGPCKRTQSISWLAEELLIFEQELCFKELVSL